MRWALVLTLLALANLARAAHFNVADPMEAQGHAIYQAALEAETVDEFRVVFEDRVTSMALAMTYRLPVRETLNIINACWIGAWAEVRFGAADVGAGLGNLWPLVADNIPATIAYDMGRLCLPGSPRIESAFIVRLGDSERATSANTRLFGLRLAELSSTDGALVAHAVRNYSTVTIQQLRDAAGQVQQGRGIDNYLRGMGVLKFLQNNTVEEIEARIATLDLADLPKLDQQIVNTLRSMEPEKVEAVVAAIAARRAAE